MQIIALDPVPSQLVSALLGSQNCQIAVYQNSSGLFVDLYVDGELIIGGVIAQNLNRVVRSLYLGFTGDLAFIDNQGNADPYYTGLGGNTSRFSFAYLAPTDLLPGEG